MHIILTTTVATLSVLIASCAGGDNRTSNQQSEPLRLADRLDYDYGKRYGYRDDEKGSRLPQGDKRSQYEGRGASPYFNGDVGKKSFQTKTLNNESWLGNKQFNTPTHRLSGSDSSFDRESRLSGQQAQLNGRLQTPTQVGSTQFHTEQAMENGSQEIDKPSHAHTDFRRRVFQEPDIMDYRQLHQLSIEQTKQMVDRKD